jgi:CMP-N,N'-diacetyllegionaminic acid synthase
MQSFQKQAFNVLGVILARGGSKGLPRKHLLPLLGRPLIGYALGHARQSRRLTHAVVSSDCPRIRQLATQDGFDAIDRPVDLATDSASVQDVLLHALDHEEQRLATRFDAVVTLYGNVAVRPVDLIDSAIGLLVATGCDSVRSFAPVGKFHPAWMSKIIEDQRVEALQPGSIHRRQDLEKLFHHDGGVVVSSRAIMDVAREHRDDPHAFFGSDRRGVIVEQGDVVEVDSRRDLMMAEAAVREQFLGLAVAA